MGAPEQQLQAHGGPSWHGTGGWWQRDGWQWWSPAGDRHQRAGAAPPCGAPGGSGQSGAPLDSMPKITTPCYINLGKIRALILTLNATQAHMHLPLGKLTRSHACPQPQRVEPSSPRCNHQWRSCARTSSSEHQHGPGTMRSRCTALMVDGALSGNVSFATVRFLSTRGTRRTTSHRGLAKRWAPRRHWGLRRPAPIGMSARRSRRPRARPPRRHPRDPWTTAGLSKGATSSGWSKICKGTAARS